MFEKSWVPILFLGYFYQGKLFCLGSGSISQISNPHQIQPMYTVHTVSCRIGAIEIWVFKNFWPFIPIPEENVKKWKNTGIKKPNEVFK